MKNKELKNPFPLGLPKGSVRAIITILALGTFFTASIMSMSAGWTIPEGLTNISLMVVAFYFGTRGASNDVQNETIIQGNVRDFENIESKEQSKYQKVGSLENKVETI